MGGLLPHPRREATWVPPFYTATTLPTHGEDGNVLIWVTSIATEEVVEANEDELILADLDAQ